MKTKLRKLQAASFSIILLMIVFIQFSCKKENDKSYISQEDFINNLKGEWYVQDFHQINSVNEDVVITRTRYLLFWQNYQHDYQLSYGDSIICTLPKMENMQDWTISQSGSELILESVDLCGGHKNYKIEYSNYRYMDYWGGTSKDAILADINLIGKDTVVLNEFQIYFIDSSQLPEPKVNLEFNVLKNNYTEKQYYLLRP